MKNALVVVDVQTAFMNEHTDHLPKKISAFIQKHHFDFILFVKFVNDENSNWVKLLNWRKMINMNETKFVEEFGEFTNKDNVFVKEAKFSAFRVKAFEKFLEEHKISDLYICGLDTDACVYTTTMEAFERGFNIKVISDLCADHHGKRHHEMAIELLTRNLSKKVVINSEEVTLGK